MKKQTKRDNEPSLAPQLVGLVTTVNLVENQTLLLMAKPLKIQDYRYMDVNYIGARQ
jgi:hypothetical protein